MPDTAHGADIGPAGPARPGASAHCSCGAWWTGLTRAHCPACHITCSSDTAAARHRVGRFGIDRRCIDPAEAGLIPTTRAYGTLWSLPAAAAPHWDRAAE
ncbi:hypothetical protein [Streptomyces erythrochromogenes]|uniref:FDXHR family putative zinc-binding protein n=1 Tax=Streptomyces erythrochromogenes TaxID=285574 RepID=UPI0038663330|nr:hypothetical protein OG364_29480 [Streptomyces erythrochromogenes]